MLDILDSGVGFRMGLRMFKFVVWVMELVSFVLMFDMFVFWVLVVGYGIISLGLGLFKIIGNNVGWVCFIFLMLIIRYLLF